MRSAIVALPLTLVAALMLATPAANAAVQFNDKTVIGLTVYVPCAAGGTGEVLDLTGPLHTLLSFNINANNVTGYFHFQPQGVTGVGETSGDKYQATGVTQESFKNSFHNGQANSTYVNNFRIVGQGSGDNFLVHETLHFTVSATGRATVFHDNFSVQCK